MKGVIDMPRVSVRELLLYVAFACVMLTFTRMPFLIGGALLVGVVAVANVVLPTRLWRHAAWGGVAGIVAAIVAQALYLNLMVDLPVGYPRTAADVKILDRVERAQPFVFQLGALAGATLGIAVYGARAE